MMSTAISALDTSGEEHLFRVRETARRRAAVAVVPEEITLLGDGAAIVAFGGHDRLLRFESVAECLETYGLFAIDLDPVTPS